LATFVKLVPLAYGNYPDGGLVTEAHETGALASKALLGRRLRRHRARVVPVCEP